MIVVLCCRVKGRWTATSNRPFLDSCRVDLVAAYLQMDQRQWTAWWASNRTARRQVEGSVVARTVNQVSVDERPHGARQMRALLAVRNHLPFTRAHNEAIILPPWICERQYPAYRDRVERGHSGDLGFAAAPAPPIA